MKRKALFLDRDGVINIDKGYVYRKEDFIFIDGIFDLVYKANKFGYLIIVVTNQAGIGRGYYTEIEFNLISNWMKKQFLENNCFIDDIYFCPYHSEYGIGKYKKTSSLRKPSPGMLLQAKEKYDIDMKHSILVGDNTTDMEAGKDAGIRTLFLYNNSYMIDNYFISIAHLNEVISYLL